VNFPSRCRNHVLLAVILLCCCAVPLPAQTPEPVDLPMVTRIRQEGFRNSKVMDTLSELADRIGARLTGSPNMKKANQWTREQLHQWGLSNAHLESFSFGRGWSEEFTSVRMVVPDVVMLHAIPKAWTPGTNGVVRGKVVQIRATSQEDLEKYRGKLAGMIVLIGEPREFKPPTESPFLRFTDQKLQELNEYPVPPERQRGPYGREAMLQRFRFLKALPEFMVQEKVLAVIEPSHFDGGALTMSGATAYKVDQPINSNVPTLDMAIEPYGRVSRLLEQKVAVELELDVRVRFYEDDPMAYNTIAEIPGVDKEKKDEVVLLGAHLDSWHGGTGATDNAAGVAVVMEAARILKALGVKPRRTIRVALWSGEEEGLFGSRAYVAQHLATRPEPADPAQKDLPFYMRRETAPLELKPDYNKFFAYFNIDNGSGRIRGIFAQENAAARPIFEAWIEPFKDLGVTSVIMRNTGGTDHSSFDSVGLPGFQFLQDPLDYFTRTHHTNLDVYEHVQRDDLIQQAVVLASFAYHAAMRDQMLPRKPLLAPDYNRSDPMPSGISTGR
jgi:carboxypeptidase Q